MKLKRKVQPSEAVLAALASGASEEHAELADNPPETPGTTEVETPPAEAAAAEPPAPAASEAALEAPVAEASQIAQLSEQITKLEAEANSLRAANAYLSDQLPKAQAQVASLTSQLELAQTAGEKFKLEASALEASVRVACETLGVALNVPKEVFSGLAGVALANQYNTLREQFNKRFKVGGVARPVGDTPAQAGGNVTHIDPVNQAAVRATNLPRK